MFFFNVKPLLLQEENIFLRLPTKLDYIQWVNLRNKNQAFLGRWEPDGSFQKTSYRNFKLRVKWAKKGFKDGKVLSLLIFQKSSKQLIGSITLENIMTRPFYSGRIGYWLGSEYYRLGYMSSAISCIIDFSEKKWGVSKVYAATLPDNTASINLLKKLNFYNEGVCKKYLRIKGIWRDHLIFSYLTSDRN